MKFTTRIAVLLSAFALPVLPAVAQAPVAAVAQAEDAKLTAFLDGEFAEWVKTQPQLATRLGIKAGLASPCPTAPRGVASGPRWTPPSRPSQTAGKAPAKRSIPPRRG